MRVFFFTVALLAFGACDSSSPTAPPVVAPPPVVPPPSDLTEFTVSGVPASVQYEIGNEDVYYPGRYFGTSYPSDTRFDFAVSGPQLTATPVANRVDVVAVEAGETEILITATAQGYRDATVIIPVRVIPGRCPPGATSAMFDQFPSVIGEAWQFDYRSRQTGPISSQIVGTLTLTLLSETCEKSERVSIFEQKIVGVKTTDYSSTEYDRTSTTSARETSERRVTLDLRPESMQGFRATFPRYRSAPGRYRYDTTEGFPMPPVCELSDSAESYFEFETGRGLVAEAVICTRDDGRSFDRVLTRRP